MTKHRLILFVTIVAASSLALFLVSCKTIQSRADLPVIAGAKYVGSGQCGTCHEEVTKDFKGTIHARLADFEVKDKGKGCESCHGPGSMHVEGGGDKTKILSFKALSAGQKSEVCLQCHKNEPVMNWRGNEHSLNGVSCSDCHGSHKSSRKYMLVEEEGKLCFKCHEDKKAQMNYPSHHPIREGKMSCASCHTPHGGGKGNIKADTVNDLCFNCHTEKQGPFTYEHVPVTESCVTCHNAHGTVAASLLKSSQPYLCMQCHPGHRGDHRWYATASKGFRQAFYTKCTYCHSQIHGTDLPNQTGSGRFSR